MARVICKIVITPKIIVIPILVKYGLLDSGSTPSHLLNS
ncbi:unnamed protein product [Acidithrix sp. C25]|nr:unnamed protein product [Acidithrix sp. C25]